MARFFSKKKFGSVTILLSLFFLLGESSSNTQMYSVEIKKTREDVSDKTAEYVYKRIMARSLNTPSEGDDNTQFGLHGMERPAVNYGVETDKVEKAFELLSRAGVDSLRSSEATWHRIADKEGNPTKLNDLKFQLNMAKKYGMNHLFVVGYPPAKFSIARNKLSAVNPKFYPQYDNYFKVIFNQFQGFDIKYVELGNEVDAPKVWWINSTPAMYVHEMSMLKKAANKYYPNVKTVAFASTYARVPGRGGAIGGRHFIEKSFQLGIDKYTDAYSIHHYSLLNADDLPGYMHSRLSKYKIAKPVLDTEQLDTGVSNSEKSNPYDIIKLFARAFSLHDMKRMDYFIAKDGYYFSKKLYSMGLFDAEWRPKLRLLAYAMASDAMKGKQLVFMASPADNVEAYVLQSNNNKKYTIVMWQNNNHSGSVKPVSVKGIKGNVEIEKWNLDREIKSDISGGIFVNDKPLAIYTNERPNWRPINKKNFLEVRPISAVSHSPMPLD